MHILVTALRPEAEPFIEQLRLRRNLAVQSHEVYRSETHLLIISGVGSISSAIATTLAAQISEDIQTITNLGVCGAHQSIPIGALCRPTKITDHSSKESFYPDVTLQDRSTKITLHTVRALNSELILEQGEAVDMEGAGFFKAAKQFVSLEKIFVYKIVSDHNETNEITKDFIRSCVSPHVETLLHHIEESEALLAGIPNPLTESDCTLLKSIEKMLRLTHSQKQQLFEKAVTFRVRSTTCSLPIDLKLCQPAEATPEQRKKIFQQVIYALS